MLIYSLDQECALGRNPFAVPTGHILDTKWPWSTCTGFLLGMWSQRVLPRDLQWLSCWGAHSPWAQLLWPQTLQTMSPMDEAPRPQLPCSSEPFLLHLKTCRDGQGGILWPSSGDSFSVQHWSGLFGHCWMGGIQPVLHRARPGQPLPRERAALGEKQPRESLWVVLSQDCITLPSYDLDWECLSSPVLFSAPLA